MSGFGDFRRPSHVYQAPSPRALVEIAPLAISGMPLSNRSPTHRKLTNADRCVVFRVEANGNRLVAILGDGQTIGLPTAGIAGHVVATSEAVSLADAYSDPMFSQQLDNKTNYKTTSLLTVPVVSQGVPTSLNYLCILQQQSILPSAEQPTPNAPLPPKLWIWQ